MNLATAQHRSGWWWVVWKSSNLRSCAVCSEGRRGGGCHLSFQPRRRDHQPGGCLCEDPLSPLSPLRLTLLSRSWRLSAGADPTSSPPPHGSTLGSSFTSRRQSTPTAWRWWVEPPRPSRWFSRVTSWSISSLRGNRRNHQSKWEVWEDQILGDFEGREEKFGVTQFTMTLSQKVYPQKATFLMGNSNMRVSKAFYVVISWVSFVLKKLEMWIEKSILV